jgi:hypothetical protein
VESSFSMGPWIALGGIRTASFPRSGWPHLEDRQVSVERDLRSVGDRPRARALRVRAERSVGNTEGTPPRARASTTGYSSSGDSFFLRGFRARGFPVVPAVPASLLDGNEAQTGTRGIDRCGAVLYRRCWPDFRGVPKAYSPITHQRRGTQLRSPAYSAGT